MDRVDAVLRADMVLNVAHTGLTCHSANVHHGFTQLPAAALDQRAVNETDDVRAVHF